MDLILKTATTGLNSSDVILELAICDRNYKTLFNERFKPLRKRSWKEAERIHGISYQDVKKCCRFKDRVEEIKSILRNNRVIIFNTDFDARLLEQTCKVEVVDHSWVDELEMLCCMAVAGGAYKNYANYYGGIRSDVALRLAIQENKSLNLEQPESLENYRDYSAMTGCVRTAFIFNVIIEEHERRWAKRIAEYKAKHGEDSLKL